MYFHSRRQAGLELASKLDKKYLTKKCIVIGLDDGGVVIGSEIARLLHCSLYITVSEQIDLPQEPWAVGGLTTDGQYVSNTQYSKADLDELELENRGYIEEQRTTKFHNINHMLSKTESIDRKLLTGNTLILTSDGLQNTFKLDLAMTFIKTVTYDKLVILTPLASVDVVDWMHVHADEIYCLSVVEDLSDTNHYYDVNDIPDHESLLKILSKNILSWQ